MKDQHEKIKGYRDLSQEEIDLMNRIKVKGAELLALQAELQGKLATDHELKYLEANKSVGNSQYQGIPYTVNDHGSDECIEFRRFRDAEPMRWVAIGKTDIQTGIMALIRAIAQPSI